MKVKVSGGEGYDVEGTCCFLIHAWSILWFNWSKLIKIFYNTN